MKILVAGDFLPYDRVAKLFDLKEFKSVFSQVKQQISDADYSMVNLECPICKGGEKAIEKLGPIHKCSNSVIGALQYVGFDCVTLANNHFRDFGDEGCLNTLKELDENGIDHVGGGKNIADASAILYHDIDGRRLAVVNCCEHEFSIATDDLAGSNPLNPVRQFYSIQEAKANADYVIVIVHGGHEHYQLPSPRMVETYRFFVDVGADAVINHHQHCFSGYEVYHDKPIFYGLGNFCFDKPVKRADKWNEGYMVQLIIDNIDIRYELIPYIQCDEKPTVAPMMGDRAKTFYSKIKEQNDIIIDTEKLKNHFKQWCHLKLAQKEAVFSSYYGSFLEKLYRKGLIPTINSLERMMTLNNHIECESHRDTTLYYFHSNL